MEMDVNALNLLGPTNLERSDSEAESSADGFEGVLAERLASEEGEAEFAEEEAPPEEILERFERESVAEDGEEEAATSLAPEELVEVLEQPVVQTDVTGTAPEQVAHGANALRTEAPAEIVVDAQAETGPRSRRIASNEAADPVGRPIVRGVEGDESARPATLPTTLVDGADAEALAPEDEGGDRVSEARSIAEDDAFEQAAREIDGVEEERTRNAEPRELAATTAGSDVERAEQDGSRRGAEEQRAAPEREAPESSTQRDGEDAPREERPQANADEPLALAGEPRGEASGRETQAPTDASRTPSDVAANNPLSTPLSTPLTAAPIDPESTAPGRAVPAAAADNVAVQTEWLVTRGGGSARLVLHPPELGEIAIRVTVRDGVVDVMMVAQESSAKAIAEQQSERLAQAFSNRDLRMDSFEVRRGDAASLGQDGDAPYRDASAEQRGEQNRGADGHAGRDANGGVESALAGGAHPTEGVLPRVVSIAPEAGVDLRI